MKNNTVVSYWFSIFEFNYTNLVNSSTVAFLSFYLSGSTISNTASVGLLYLIFRIFSILFKILVLHDQQHGNFVSRSRIFSISFSMIDNMGII